MNRGLAGLPIALGLGGCAGLQSMTGAAGLQSRQFSDMLTLFLAITGFFYVLVIVGLLAALVRRRRAEAQGGAQGGERVARSALAGWLGAVALGLTVLTITSYVADREVAAATPARPHFTIELTAHQWWWDVRYKNDTPADELRTANELHLPVGVPVMVTLKSADVIHSFWVPPLAGKQDMIPGRVTDALLLPTRIGVYRGQCAEFCGVQHAHMALDVTVESLADFRRWWRGGLAPGAAPATPLARAGYGLVTGAQCANCHNIAGTPASGTFAPDLTHLASRRSIAAGTFPMTRGHLYAWVADPQSAKPGNNMPVIGLNAQQLHSVLAYLQGLK